MNAQSRPLALVTGGSSGIGLELARVLGDLGYDVIINGENSTKLAEAAHILHEETGARIDSVAADLSTRGGVEKLYERVRQEGRSLDVFCHNAGVGSGGGDFTETDLDEELRLVDLNVRSYVHLTKLVARDMAARGEGRILLTSSIASLMPGPFEAVYAATKAFVRSFGEALRNELADKGVIVTVLKPGPTDTDFFRRAHMLDTPANQGPKDDPVSVAERGVKALMRDSHSVIAASLRTKAQAAAASLMSDPMRARAHRMQTEPYDHREEGRAHGSHGAAKGALAVGAIAAATAAGWWLNKRREQATDESRPRAPADDMAVLLVIEE